MEKRPQEEEESKSEHIASLEPEQQRIDSILKKAFLSQGDSHILPKMNPHLENFKTGCNRPSVASLNEHAGEFHFDAEPIYESSTETDPGHHPKPKIDDNRVIITNTKAWPSSVHGLVLVTNNEGKKHWGTGFLILNNVVLTSAHVLMKQGDEKLRVDSIKFLPAFQGEAESFEQSRVVDYFIPKEWRQAGKEDYALLLLESPIGKKTGHFGLSVLDPESIKLKNLTVTGYPADKKSKNQYEMWEMSGKAQDVKGGTLFYDIFTNHGQSGSAVWYVEDNNYYAIGVHVASDISLGLKSGTLITRVRYERMQAWIEQAVLKFFPHQQSVHRLKLEEDLSIKEIEILAIENLPNLEEVYGDREEVLEKFPEKNPFQKNTLYPCLGKSGAQALAQNYSWRNLVKLTLRNHSIGDEGVKSLAENKDWPNLKVLDLENNEIGPPGAKSLARNKTWELLEELNLSHNPLQDEGISNLTGNTTWGYLGTLYLIDTGFSKEGAEALATCKNWPELRVLDISWNEQIGDKGIIVFVEHSNLDSKWDLRHLNLSSVGLGPMGVEYLAKNGNWKNLGYLNLTGNDIKEEGAQGLANNESWIKLKKLILEYCNIEDSGAKNLAENESWISLKELILDSNHIEDDGAKILALGNWELDLLSLCDNKISWEGEQSLREESPAHNFQRLYLDDNDKI